jgi:hypothetical protein
MNALFGALKSIDERRSGELKGLRAVELILTFEKERVVQRVVFDSDGKVAGLVYQLVSMAVRAHEVTLDVGGQPPRSNKSSVRKAAGLQLSRVVSSQPFARGLRAR